MADTKCVQGGKGVILRMYNRTLSSGAKKVRSKRQCVCIETLDQPLFFVVMSIPSCAYFVCLCRKDDNTESNHTQVTAMNTKVFLMNLNLNSLQRPVAALGPFVYFAARIKAQWERTRCFERRVAFAYALKRLCPGLILFINKGNDTELTPGSVDSMYKLVEPLKGCVYSISTKPSRDMREDDVIYLDCDLEVGTGTRPRPS